VSNNDKRSELQSAQAGQENNGDRNSVLARKTVGEDRSAPFLVRLGDDTWADLRYAFRAIRRAPVASTVATAILALAIGVNVALFTFLDAYAFRKLPVPAADRYVKLVETNERNQRFRQWTRDEFDALNRGLESGMEGMYASTDFDASMLEPIRRIVRVQAVSSNYFKLLGAKLALGRTFTEDEERSARQGNPVVLSHPGWQKLLNGDNSVIGRTIRLGRTSYTVVGVTAPDFRGVGLITPELWMPLGSHAALMQRPGGTLRYDVAGVLKTGVSPERASALGSVIVATFDRPLDTDRSGRHSLLVESHTSFFNFQDGDRNPLIILGFLVLGAFGCVLLIACANLASLYVARASARHHEIAIRLSLGASPRRLIRQLLTESLVLAVLSAILGCLLAIVSLGELQDRLFSMMTEAGLTMAPVTVDGRVLAFAICLGVISGLAFGLLPALEATSTNLASSGRRDSLTLGGRIRAQRLTSLLVIAQVTASLILMVLASLLLRAAENASQLEPGYDTASLVDLGFPEPTAAILEQLRRDPRIAAVSSVFHRPLVGNMPRYPMVAAGQTRILRYNIVDDAYFDILPLRLLSGRGFRREEAVNSAPVVVVSEATARAIWPGQNALGRVIEVKQAGGPKAGTYTVIGVAPDVVSGLFFQGRDQSAVYFPSTDTARVSGILVRPRSTGGGSVEGLQQVCQDIDETVICTPRTLREWVGLVRFPFQAGAIIASALGSLALTLTSIGLYGIVAFAVTQRIREIGLRMALGATPLQGLLLLLRRAMMNVVIGILLGLPVAVFMSHTAAKLLGLNAFDPVTLVLFPFLLLGITLCAALVPARRATQVDPAEILRTE
jgi:predicted permease